MVGLAPVRNAWQSLRPVLVRMGGGPLLLRMGILGLAETRRLLAARHLAGQGLEIGARHFPLPAPPGVTVRYVDRYTESETRLKSAEFRESDLVKPDYVEDGFTLASIADKSQDFVIANHVLEHSPNPLQAVENWARVLRPGGVLFLSVPIAAHCFDRGRPLTDVAHLLDDYRLCRSGNDAEFRSRTLAHYVEYFEIAAPAIARERGEPPPARSPREIVAEAGRFAALETDIHYHTFSVASFGRLAEVFAAEICPFMRVVEAARSRLEVIAILRRAA